PLAKDGVYTIERKERNGEGYTVAQRARFDMVVKRHFHALPIDFLGKNIGGNARGIMPHELVARELQYLGLFGRQTGIPTLQRDRLEDILGNSRIVESIDERIIDQYVRPACLMLQLLDGRNQTSIMTKKGQASGGGATLTAPAVALLLRPSRPIIDIAGHQCVTNKDLSRLFGVDAAVMHPPTGVDSKAVECRTLVRHHLPGLFFPTRFRPALTKQVCTGALHPARIYSGNAARVQPGG